MKDTIYSMFRHQAELQPDAPAVIEDGRTLTYAELDRLADAIMSRFYDAGYKSVGIVMSHGAAQIAAILAVLKSGACYVPAEPSLPQERIDYMMKQADVGLIIDDAFCRDVAESDVKLADRSRPDGLAYVLYTSGTSGRPKGVMIENHSVVNYCRAFENEFHTGPGWVMLQYSVCSFDIFVEEVFTTLLNGAALAIPPASVRNGTIRDLMDFVERHQVSIVDGFPYLLDDMNELPSIPKCIKLLISGGDVIRESYISRLRTEGPKIYNTYGPSETTVCCTYFRVDNAEALPDGTFPVGKPVKGVRVEVVGADGRPAPAGEVGEFYISGEGVARGYLGNPPEEVNFETLPDGTRVYHSGDMGYKLPDGNLAFLHRRDSQVMILGKRVEPDEVENVLNDCPEVQKGVVRAFTDQKGLSYLVAYVVPEGGASLSDIRACLSRRLTDFMVPEFFVKMPHIPLTPNGKPDTAELPVVLK